MGVILTVIFHTYNATPSDSVPVLPPGVFFSQVFILASFGAINAVYGYVGEEICNGLHAVASVLSKTIPTLVSLLWMMDCKQPLTVASN
jgi:hypothetical protein